MSGAEVMAPESTTIIGGYSVEQRLARGGMATIYMVRGRGPGGVTRRYALKRIDSSIGSDPYFRELFLDEARLLAQLDHPAVCRVLDYGEEGGAPFMVMEYLHGLPLDVFTDKVHRTGAMRREPRYFHMVARVVANLLEGLHAAHELHDVDGTPLNVVHRDISPHNLFALYDGTQRVLDFGIASASQQVHLTTCGTVKGKFGYMPPEQAVGEPTDRRADVWAMGVVLWELLAGRCMFAPALTRQEILAQSVHGLPAPSSVDPRVPKKLDEVVRCALSVAPEDRYPTARSMARELELWLSERGDSVPAADVGEWIRRTRRVMDNENVTASTPELVYERDASGSIVPPSLDDVEDYFRSDIRPPSKPSDETGSLDSGERETPGRAFVTTAATPNGARSPTVRTMAQGAPTQASTPARPKSADLEVQAPAGEAPAVEALGTQHRPLWIALAVAFVLGLGAASWLPSGF